MSTEQAAATADKASFAGTPVRDLIAGATAFAVVVIGAHLLANTLKGVIDDTVRNGAVGVLFASVPAVYGVVRKVTFSVGPKPEKPSPELAPWYITALFAGACLFSWSQFFGFIIGVASGAAAPSLGQEPLKIAGAILGILQLPLLLIWAVVAGKYLYSDTRSWTPLALIAMIVIFIALNMLMNFVIMPGSTEQLMTAMGAEFNWGIIAMGFATVGVTVLIGALIGMLIGAIRRSRGKARLVSLYLKLKREEREAVIADLRERILATTAAED